MTLRDYVEEQRLRKAISLLTETGLTLSEIAFECGFSSQSYFNYAFKKRLHLTPRAYAAEVQLRYDL
jgi:AraC-like DNA-binding protein